MVESGLHVPMTSTLALLAIHKYNIQLRKKSSRNTTSQNTKIKTDFIAMTAEISIWREKYIAFNGGMFNYGYLLK